MGKASAKYEPTPEDIKTECERIRSQWSARELTRRQFSGRTNWSVPLLHGREVIDNDRGS